MVLTSALHRSSSSCSEKDYKNLYKVALDEVSALLERNCELEAKLEEFQRSHPEQIVTLTQKIAQLKRQLDNTAETRASPSEIVPLALQVQNKAPFDKIILSLGMLGTIKSAEALESLRLKFDFNNMSNLRDDKEDYLSQFLPMIVEDLRSKIVQRFAEIEKTLPPPNIADVIYIDTTEDTNQSKSKPRHKQKVQENSQFVTLSCTTPKRKFPTVDHGFNKELMCVVLPSSKINPKSLNVVLAIGSVHPCSDPGEENTHYSVTMLAHDHQHLLLHERSVKQSDTVSRLHWHHLVGLVPSARMYEACSPGAPLLFPQQILYHQQVQWPEHYSEEGYHDGFNLPTSLNETQSNVVKSFAATDERGMFYLVGPPGTGKTTTIALLLIERVRCYPDEKILLTAPSNKAIQVVLQKLMGELKKKGSDIALAVIDTGKRCSANHEMLSVGNFISSLIKQFNDVLRFNTSWGAKKDQLMVAVDTVVAHFVWLLDPAREGLPVDEESIDPIEEALDWFSNNNCHSVCDEKSLKDQVRDCKQQLQRAAEHVDTFILQKAQIVFGTLIACGRRSLTRAVPSFDTVIVDEASQALLPATFIPFKFGPARYLLVGDPQQLPATVNADKLKDLGYADSLMLVMQTLNQGKDAVMLTTQYRMHPSICKPISDLFYKGKLVTAQSVLARPSELKKLLPQMALSALPSAFIDLDSVEYQANGGSTSNSDEAALVVKMVKYLLEHGIKPSQIGVNTGYKAQVLLIQDLLHKMVWDSVRLRDIDLRELAVSTVDGFQGDERDFILFSCVRTNTHSVGFLKDHRRINVALSRARHACWVFGQRRCLAESNSSIRDFLDFTTFPSPSACTTFPPTAVVSADALLLSMGEKAHVAHASSASRWGPLPVRETPPPHATAPTVPTRGVKRGPPGELFQPAPPPPSLSRVGEGSRAVHIHTGTNSAAPFVAPSVTLGQYNLIMQPTLSALGPNQRRALGYKKGKKYAKNKTIVY